MCPYLLRSPEDFVVSINDVESYKKISSHGITSAPSNQSTEPHAANEIERRKKNGMKRKTVIRAVYTTGKLR